MSNYGLHILGDDSLDHFAEQIVATETALASISKSSDELYIDSATKTRYNSSQLQTLASAINWPDYFASAIESKSIDWVYVQSADYLGNVQKLLSSGSLGDLKPYFAWHILLTHANQLPIEAVHTMRSVNNNLVEDDSESCLIQTNYVFGDLIGRYFPQANRDKVEFIEQLYTDIRSVLAKNMPKFGWMDRMVIGRAIYKVVKLNSRLRKISEFAP